MTAAAVNRQSVIIDGRQVPMHNGTVTKQRGSSAASDNSIPAVPQRARPNQPLKNPLAHYPPVPPIPSLPQSLAGQARKSVERQVPGFDLNNPQPQSSSFTSRTSGKQDAWQPPTRTNGASDYIPTQNGSRTPPGAHDDKPLPRELLQQTHLESRDDRDGRILEDRLEDFDLAAPIEDGEKLESLEQTSDLLFSGAHMEAIFADPSFLLKFMSFLKAHRPQSVPTLMYYLDASKALKAIHYANAVAAALEPLQEQGLTPIQEMTRNFELEQRAWRAFNLLVQDDLPAYVTLLYIQVAKSNINPSTISGQPNVQETSEGFAEVFCLTDPSRPDNPIVFASKAFHSMTQYSMNYIVGRNCRFLQGPKTNRLSIDRIRNAVQAGREHCEVILNYRRDGSPFLNLLMHAPLRDATGKVRYFMGAQIDVSSVTDVSPELGSLQKVIAQVDREKNPDIVDVADDIAEKKGEFQQLVETLDMQELKAARTWQGRMLQEVPEGSKDLDTTKWHKPAVHIRDPSYDAVKDYKATLDSLYNYFLLVRPYPSLRILFASPALSGPGIVHGLIMDKFRVNARIRDELSQALIEGREVTAKALWIPYQNETGANKWIHFTPLFGSKDQVGAWMVILEEYNPDSPRRQKQPPPSRVPNGMTSPIPEEDEDDDYDDEPPIATVPHINNGNVVHKAQISWSGPEVAPEHRKPTLHWSSNQQYDENASSPSIDGTMESFFPETDDEYESLKERLRRKRMKDAVKMLEQPGFVPRKTYKSLAPDDIISDGTM